LYGLITAGFAEPVGPSAEQAEDRTSGEEGTGHLDHEKLLAYLEHQAEFADEETRRQSGMHIADCPTCSKRLQEIHIRRSQGLPAIPEDQTVDSDADVPDRRSGPDRRHSESAAVDEGSDRRIHGAGDRRSETRAAAVEGQSSVERRSGDERRQSERRKRRRRTSAPIDRSDKFAVDRRSGVERRLRERRVEMQQMAEAEIRARVGGRRTAALEIGGGGTKPSGSLSIGSVPGAISSTSGDARASQNGPPSDSGGDKSSKPRNHRNTRARETPDDESTFDRDANDHHVPEAPSSDSSTPDSEKRPPRPSVRRTRESPLKGIPLLADGTEWMFVERVDEIDESEEESTEQVEDLDATREDTAKEESKEESSTSKTAAETVTSHSVAPEQGGETTVVDVVPPAPPKEAPESAATEQKPRMSKWGFRSKKKDDEAQETRKELQRKQLELLKAHRELDRAKSDSERAQQEAERARSEADRAKSVAAKTKREAEQAQSEAAATKLEAEKAKSEAEKAKADAAKAKADAAKAKAAKAEKEHRELEKARQELEKAKTESDRAKQEAERARSEADKARAEAEEATRKAEQAEANAARAKSNAETVKSEASKRKSEASQTATEAKKAKQQIAKAKADAETAREEADKAKTEAERAREDADRAREDSEKAKADVDRARDDAENAKAEAEKARFEADSARADADEARVEADKAKADAERARADTERSKQELERARSEVEELTHLPDLVEFEDEVETTEIPQSRIGRGTPVTLSQLGSRTGRGTPVSLTKLVGDIPPKPREETRDESPASEEPSATQSPREKSLRKAPAIYLAAAAAVVLALAAGWVLRPLLTGAGESRIASATIADDVIAAEPRPTPTTTPPAILDSTDESIAAEQDAAAAQVPVRDPQPPTTVTQPRVERADPEPVSTPPLPEERVVENEPGVQAQPDTTAEPEVPVARTTATITGTVTQAGTGARIAGASVVIPEQGLTTTTDVAGIFAFSAVPAGSLSVAFSLDGYMPGRQVVDAAPGDNIALDLELRLPPSAADPDVELDGGQWTVSNREEAEIVLGRPVVIIEGLWIESIAIPATGTRPRVRVAQIDDTGERITMVMSRSGPANVTALPRVRALHIVPPTEAYPITTGTASFGGLMVTAKSSLPAESLRALLQRLVEASGS